MVWQGKGYRSSCFSQGNIGGWVNCQRRSAMCSVVLKRQMRTPLHNKSINFDFKSPRILLFIPVLTGPDFLPCSFVFSPFFLPIIHLAFNVFLFFVFLIISPRPAGKKKEHELTNVATSRTVKVSTA